mgnify:CR=1 FL=1
MSYGSSRFYSNVVQSFRSGNYDNGLKALMSYRVYRTTAASFRKIYNMIVPILDKIISSPTPSNVTDQAYQRNARAREIMGAANVEQKFP